MSSQKTEPMSGNNRFQSKMRHYHQSNKNDEVTWDDWIGDKVKSPARQKFDKIFVGVGTVVVGLCLLGGVVGVIYVVLKNILPIFVK
jgi:hypothetical protein